MCASSPPPQYPFFSAVTIFFFAVEMGSGPPYSTLSTSSTETSAPLIVLYSNPSSPPTPLSFSAWPHELWTKGPSLVSVRL
ncbi:unnamed protein product [Linum trigynum]|uniref:Uncharacterized protein n=1 Tax=Linum trigynum TaxID=586398 RepID=A0AAV2E1X1_9ROSI